MAISPLFCLLFLEQTLPPLYQFLSMSYFLCQKYTYFLVILYSETALHPLTYSPDHFSLFKASALASHFCYSCHLNEWGDFSGKKPLLRPLSGALVARDCTSISLVFFFFRL